MSLRDRMIDQQQGAVTTDPGGMGALERQYNDQYQDMFEKFLIDTGADRNPEKWTQEQDRIWSGLYTLFADRWYERVQRFLGSSAD